MGEYVCITVKDNGRGMSKAIIDRIFEPSFTTKEVGQGSGLGMSVVHGVATRLGGDVIIESAVNEGTAVRVYLPRCAKIDETLSVDQLVRNTGEQAHILIVDDEKEITIMLATVFNKVGYRVTSTHLSATALRLLQDSPSEFDLLITDKSMPGMTGIELVKSLTELKIDIPVIMMTGYSGNDTELKNVGIAAIVKKPFAMSMLKATVADLLTAARGRTKIIE